MAVSSRARARPRTGGAVVDDPKQAGSALTASMATALEAFARDRNLTRRETQVLLMVCQGYKDLAIASQLKISRATVRFHISNIHKKSGTSDKLEIVLAAWRGCGQMPGCD